MQKQKIPIKEKVSSRKKMPTEACPLEMQSHIQGLGLSSVKAYKMWCRAHDFSLSLNKSVRQRRKELDLVGGIKATATLRKKKKDGSILEKIIPMLGALETYDTSAKILKDVESTIDVKLGRITGTVVENMIEAFGKSTKPELLQGCLLHLDANSNLLRGEYLHDYNFYCAIYIDYIRELVDDFEGWVRPLQRWHPKSHCPSRQFSELLRHLYAAYPVPRFMDHAWKKGGAERDWFKHVAAGQNIRTAEDLPIPLTKKMAHYFLMAPRHYNIEKAFIWAQVRSVGGGRRLMNALWKKFELDYMEWGYSERFVDDNDFWLNVMRFFSANPKLQGGHVDLIVDYVYTQKYENARDPTDFHMKGRTADALLRQAEAWQQDLKEVATLKEVRWPRSGIGAFHYQEVDTPSGSQKSWSIRELCSTTELAAEGRALSHCLRHISRFDEDFLYAKHCYKGKTSIWTMEMREDTSKCRKVLTLLVWFKDIPTITEVSGMRNRGPTAEEVRLIEKWADQEGLKYDYF